MTLLIYRNPIAAVFLAGTSSVPTIFIYLCYNTGLLISHNFSAIGFSDNFLST